MSATSPITGAANTAAAGTSTTDTISTGSQQALTQNDFLQLLVAQMQNQDPMNPQSDTDMAAQMAQFTSLTQATNMSSSLSMLQANSLIGSTVTLQTDSQGDTITGVVQAVRAGAAATNGVPQIVINGTGYNVSQVLSITPTVVSDPANTNQTSN